MDPATQPANPNDPAHSHQARQVAHVLDHVAAGRPLLLPAHPDWSQPVVVTADALLLTGLTLTTTSPAVCTLLPHLGVLAGHDPAAPTTLWIDRPASLDRGVLEQVIIAHVDHLARLARRPRPHATVRTTPVPSATAVAA